MLVSYTHSRVDIRECKKVLIIYQRPHQIATGSTHTHTYREKGARAHTHTHAQQTQACSQAQSTETTSRDQIEIARTKKGRRSKKKLKLRGRTQNTNSTRARGLFTDAQIVKAWRCQYDVTQVCVQRTTSISRARRYRRRGFVSSNDERRLQQTDRKVRLQSAHIFKYKRTLSTCVYACLLACVCECVCTYTHRSSSLLKSSCPKSWNARATATRLLLMVMMTVLLLLLLLLLLLVPTFSLVPSFLLPKPHTKQDITQLALSWWWGISAGGWRSISGFFHPNWCVAM